MKERPMLFNSKMVQAILSGAKTQTRRVIKPQPVHDTYNNLICWTPKKMKQHFILNNNSGLYMCPRGKPKDRIWVRETFRYEGYGSRTKGDNKWHDYMTVQYKSDEQEIKIDCTKDIVDKYYNKCSDDILGDPWRPSIHMPRWASRINLEIINVRVERLKKITREDAIAEGIKKDPQKNEHRQFRRLWWRTCGESSWNKNPWVWVLEFKIIKKAPA